MNRRLPSVSLSIATQLFCRGWAGLLTLGLSPYYVRYLGIEAYGVIGVYTTAQTLLTILDFGLGITLAREIARLSARAGSEQLIHDWVKTVEILGGTMATLLGICIFVFSPSVVGSWLHPKSLATDELADAWRMAALALTLQWPAALYTNGMNGVQRQVAAGVSLAAFATLRNVGSLVILALFEGGLIAFFAFHALIGFLYTLANRALLRAALPGVVAWPAFRPNLVRSCWRFAAGMLGLSAVTILITQTDKIILSRLLTLDAFGFFTFAGTAAAGITLLCTPVFGVLMPRFAQLSAQHNNRDLSGTYHLACQFLAIAVVPLSVTCAAFSIDILRIWTANPVLVENVSSPFALLVLGNAANGLMVVPYTLKIALGMSGLALKVASGLLIVQMPMTAAAALHFGGTGAAAVWLTLNMLYVCTGSLALHRRALQGEWSEWLFQDVAPILGASLGVVGIFVGANTPGSTPLLTIAAAWITAAAVSIVFSRRVTAWFRSTRLNSPPTTTAGKE